MPNAPEHDTGASDVQYEAPESLSASTASKEGGNANGTRNEAPPQEELSEVELPELPSHEDLKRSVIELAMDCRDKGIKQGFARNAFRLKHEPRATQWGLTTEQIDRIFKQVYEARPGEEVGRPLKVWDLMTVAGEPDRMDWLIQTVWPLPSYGMLAGAEKAMKSYLSTLMALAVASGQPFLDEFPVVNRGPVLVFTGEAGRRLWVRRAKHLAQGMGLDRIEFARLPIRIVEETAPVLSERFQATLTTELKRDPVLVILDPLYTYHGGEASASNVYEMAPVLNGVSEPVQAAGASLVVVNHFTKAGAANLSLSSITQAGSREWADSWALVKHRSAPDLTNGMFSLRVEVGSRQWGAEALDVDLSLGPFDKDNFRWVRPPTWDVSPADDERPASSSAREFDAKAEILTLVTDNPETFQRSGVYKELGDKKTVREALKSMLDEGLLTEVPLAVEEGGRKVKRRVLRAAAPSWPGVEL